MTSIGLEGLAVASGRQPATTATQGVAPGDGTPPLGFVDYCRLAEECFFLAAVARDIEVAAELGRAGDDYLGCSAAALLAGTSAH
jgi:hypothetical protein